MKRIIQIAFVLIAVLSSYYIISAYTMARPFRRAPNVGLNKRIFFGNSPDKIIARLIVFKRGTDFYNSKLRSFIYRPGVLPDSYWNRWILEKDIAKMSSQELFSYLPFYPLTPSERLLPAMRDMLLQGVYSAFLVLNKTSAGQEICRNYVAEYVIKSRNVLGFTSMIPYLLKLSCIDFIHTLDSLWPHLDNNQRDIILFEIRKSLQPNSLIINKLLLWVEKQIVNEQIPDCGLSSILCGFLSYKETRAKAISLIVPLFLELRYLENCEPQYYSSPASFFLSGLLKQDAIEVASEFFILLSNEQPNIALYFFDEICNRDILSAESITAPILESEDSILRKGIIVYLVRNNSIIGESHIDEAFSGLAPRIIKFRSVHQYIYGSKAADEYRFICRHDYLETGKKKPPLYLNGDPLVDEVSRWRVFIDKYPWFPGTDDAYYRLAYRQYSDGDFDGAIYSITEYLNRQLIDNDARPIILELLEDIQRKRTNK